MMTDLEKLEAAEKIIDRSFINIKGNFVIPSEDCTVFTDKNGKPLSPETRLWELVDGLTEDTKLIEIRLVKMKATKK